MDADSATLQFPISLDAVISVALNVENLKVILEFLLGIIRKHEDQLLQLKARPPDPESEEEEASEHELAPKEEHPEGSKPVASTEGLPKALLQLQALMKRLKKRKREITAETDRNSVQDKQLFELKERLQTQETQVQAALGQMDRRASTLEEALAGERQSRQTLEGRVGEWEGRAKDLQGQVRELEERVRGLEERKVEPSVIVKEVQTVTVVEQAPQPPASKRTPQTPASRRTPRDEGETLEDASDLAQRVSELETRLSASDHRLSSCEHQLADLPPAIQACEDSVTGVASDLQALSGSVTSQAEQIQDLEGRVSGLESKHEQMQESVSEVKLAQTADEQAIRELEERLAALEKAHRGTDTRSLENQSAIEDLKKQLKFLHEELRNKADADSLDMVKSALVGMSGKSGSSAAMSLMPTKDSNLLHDLNRKIAGIEDALARLAGVSTASTKIGDFSDRLEVLEKGLKTKASSEDLDMLLGLLKRQRTDLDKLEQSLREIEERPTHISGSDQASPEAVVKAESTKLIRLSRRVDSLEETVKGFNFPDMADLGKFTQEMKRLAEMQEELRAALEKLRKEMQTRLRELEELLGRKADQSMMLEVERKC